MAEDLQLRKDKIKSFLKDNSGIKLFLAAYMCEVATVAVLVSFRRTKFLVINQLSIVSHVLKNP